MIKYEFNQAQLDSLMSISEEDGPDLVRQLFDMFQETMPGAISKVTKAVEVKDWASLSAEAHRLKSTCGNLGIHSMSMIAKALEDAGRSQGANISAEDLNLLTILFNSQLTSAIEDLKKYISLMELKKGK